MSAGLGKCSKIRHIVRLRQMLRRWRNKARMSARSTPSDVPAGHVAVCVGSSCRRFVVRATYLNHPCFRKLLVQAEEEYGFTNEGPLAIPCEESLFEELIRYISRSESSNSTRFMNFEDFQRHCHVGFKSKIDFWTESRPLLHGFANKRSRGKLVDLWVLLTTGFLLGLQVTEEKSVVYHTPKNAMRWQKVVGELTTESS